VSEVTMFQRGGSRRSRRMRIVGTIVLRAEALRGVLAALR